MLEFENDKVKLERIGYAHEYSRGDMLNFTCYISKSKPEGGFDMYRVISDEFRRTFADSIAKLIVDDWEHLVFDERFAPPENGESAFCSASMYVVIKKDEKI